MAPTLTTGEGGLEKMVLEGPGGSSAEIYLHGATLTSWRCGGVERIYTSKTAVFRPPKAIRGGIPVCWPQFGTLGPCATLAAQHGFARNLPWAVVEGGSSSSVTLALAPTPATREQYPHDFELMLTVELLAGGALRQELRVRNPAGAAGAVLPFTGALHTYLSVDDVAGAAVDDRARGGVRAHSGDESWKIALCVLARAHDGRPQRSVADRAGGRARSRPVPRWAPAQPRQQAEGRAASAGASCGGGGARRPWGRQSERVHGRDAPVRRQVTLAGWGHVLHADGTGGVTSCTGLLCRPVVRTHNKRTVHDGRARRQERRLGGLKPRGEGRVDMVRVPHGWRTTFSLSPRRAGSALRPVM